MNKNVIVITAPSLETKNNVSGISSVTNFIIDNNSSYTYDHFELGRKDNERRNLAWFIKQVRTNLRWVSVITSGRRDMIHFNLALSKASVIRDFPLLFYARLIKKKMIIHLHGGEFLNSRKAPGWMVRMLKMIFTNRIPVLVLSPLEKEKVRAEYHIENITVLPNCVDVKEAKNVSRDYLPGNGLNLLFLGRIHTTKGIDEIFTALTGLKKKGIPFTFYLAGTGPDEEVYVKKFSELLGNHFKFKGIVAGQEKMDLFKNSDVFLLPSRFEGLPMALLESMSFGLVPVVTGVGSIKYVVKDGENGVILEKDIPGEIELAVEKLSNDRNLLKKFSNNSRRYIFENYNPERYIEELNKVYAKS